MMKLYYAPHTCALAAHIALIDAGADYQTQKLDFSQQEQSKSVFLTINPKGRVPALLCDQGLLSESPAILSYIAQTHPRANLAPLDDPFQFAKVQEFNAYLASTLHVAHAHGKRAERWADDPQARAELHRKMPQIVLESFQLVENSMFKGPYVWGEQYTICDPYLFTFAQWLEADSVDPDMLPNIRDHRQMMLQRQSVQTAIKAQLATH